MRSPLFEAATGLGAGLLAATQVPAAWGPGLSALGVLLALSRRARAAALAFALGSLLAGRTDGPRPPDHVAALLGPGPVLVKLRGVAATASEPTRSGLHAFDLEVSGVVRPVRGERSTRGRIRILVREPPSPPIVPGDRLEAVGTVRESRRPSNPGEPDRSAVRRRHGRAHVLVSERAANVRVLDPASPVDPRARLASVRRAAARRLALALPPPESDLAAALLIGRRAGVPVEIEDAFRRSGAAHILAVSGLHVGLVALGGSALLGWLRCPSRIRLIVVLALVLLYAGLAGLRPPVVRAALLASLYVGACLLGRRTAPLDLLGAAAFLVLLLAPTEAERLDFRLSFVAVLGLVLLTGRTTEALFPDRDVIRRFAAWRAPPLWRRTLRDYVQRVLPATWSAWIATAPLVLYEFGTIAPVALLANLLLMPLLVASLAAAVLALALGALAAPASTILSLPIAGLRIGATLAASIPGATLDGARPPGFAIAIAYAILVFLATRPAWKRRHLAAATVTVFLPALLVLPRFAPEVDRLTVIDVGQGSSVLLERTDGAVMLYDAGSTSPDVGRRRIEPLLRSRRIRHIDTLVLSHADSDHLSAAPLLLRRFGVGALVVPARFESSPSGAAVAAIARDEGVQIRVARAGDALPPFGEVLHPPVGSALGDNDDSLVVRVRVGRHRALLTGDLEAEGVAILVRSPRDLAAEILLLPHHGGRNPALADLVRAVAPDVALASAARGFPAEPRPPGLAVRRTAEEGALVVEDGPDGPNVRGFEQSRQVAAPRTR